jgi:nuclear pore complex protein Nup54
VAKKWLPGASPDCVFQYYFYNKVDEAQVPYYQPNANEDPKAWEEALGKKPGPGYIPVLCTGYEQLGQRIKIQQVNLMHFNRALHQINDKLTACLHSHETSHSIRAMDAKRKHALLRQRCLRIATKVQVLRNRGYALGGDEEDLRTKLQELEKRANDPALGARAEEIWARMLTVQERAKVLKNEIDKSGREAPDLLDEETTRKAKKVCSRYPCAQVKLIVKQILEDYDRQLVHLKKEMDIIQKEYEEWERNQNVSSESGRNGTFRATVR